MRQKKFCEDGDFLCEFCTFFHENLSVSYILGLPPSLHDLRKKKCPLALWGGRWKPNDPKLAGTDPSLPPSWAFAVGHSQNNHSSWAVLRLGYSGLVSPPAQQLPPKQPPEPFHGVRWVLALIAAAAAWHTGRCIFKVREWEEEKKLWNCPAVWEIIRKPNNSFVYRSAKKELSFNFMALTQNVGDKHPYHTPRGRDTFLKIKW